MASKARDQVQVCSFCKRTQDEVKRLIAGPEKVFICDKCVDLCKDILYQDLANEKENQAEVLEQTPSPRDIYCNLEEWVVGQQRAKKTLAVAVYNHYKRIVAGPQDDVDMQKSNILLIGPTGCGKTLLAQTLAHSLDVPFCITDATSLTEAGYVGEDVENILLRLIQNADFDIQRAETGIIYIDEIDKIARKTGDNPSITRDVSGEGVQQALLKIIEGVAANVPPEGGRKHPHQDFIQIDTSNILFLCGGAFDGLDKIVAERLGLKGHIGFNPGRGQEEMSTAELLRQANPDDLMNYGLIPEFVGRLPVTVTVDPLDQETMVRILKEPKNALVKQFQRLFALDGVELEFREDALQTAAEKAMQQKTGARGLRSIIEATLLDVMYEIPSRPDIKQCVVTADTVQNTTAPLLFDSSQTPIDWILDDDDQQLNQAA